MPKLSPIQWIIVALFLGFYGFAVFALTRDHYLRNPPAAATVAPSPHGLSEPRREQRTWIRGAMQPSGGIVPPSVTETNPRQLQRTADELFAQRRYSEAIPLYRHVIELDPQDLDAYNDLGLALHYSGQTQAGLEVLRAGVAKDPKMQRIWLSLGFVGAQSGIGGEAQDALQKARDLGPDNSMGKEAARMLGLLQGE